MGSQEVSVPRCGVTGPVGVSPGSPERRNDLRAAEALARIVYDSSEWSGCNGSRWDALPAEATFFRIDAAANHLAALAAAGFAVVRSKDVLRAFDCGPNFLDARGRLIEEAREARAAFLAACTHPAESIVDGECWRCDSPVAAAAIGVAGEDK